MTIAAMLVILLSFAERGDEAGARSTESVRRNTLHEALAAYDKAVDAARDDSARAAAAYRQAIRGFEALVRGGVNNWALEYNLGNAYFRAGDLGRAVLHFRRAQRLAPARAAVAANLEYARRRVRPVIEPAGGAQLGERLLFWRHRTSISQRFWAAAILSAAGWLTLVAWLGKRRGWIAGLGAGCALLGVANAGLVLWQLRDEAQRPHAVVVRGETVLRHGRGEAYEPALREPLGPGVELRVLQRRGDWLEVALRDGRTGWIPASAAEQV